MLTRLPGIVLIGVSAFASLAHSGAITINNDSLRLLADARNTGAATAACGPTGEIARDTYSGPLGSGGERTVSALRVGCAQASASASFLGNNLAWSALVSAPTGVENIQVRALVEYSLDFRVSGTAVALLELATSPGNAFFQLLDLATNSVVLTRGGATSQPFALTDGSTYRLQSQTSGLLSRDAISDVAFSQTGGLQFVGVTSISGPSTAVPEPGTALLLAFGMVGAGLLARRRALI
jgi:hypothetical protein